MKLNFTFFFLPLLLIISCEQKMIDKEEITYVSERVKTPVITPIGGVFYDNQIIELSSDTEGSTIIYTTDGTNPTRSNGKTYKGRFAVNIFTIVKAFAYKENLNDSTIVRSAYSFKVSAPVYSSSGKIFTSDEIFSYDTKIEIANNTPDSTIYYTIDGSTPTSASNMYTVPLTLSFPITLKTIAYKYGWSYSKTQSINFGFKVDRPSVYPPGGNYDSTVDIVLSPTIYGAKIYYTLDGNDPTSSSALYSAPISIGKTTTVKAVALKDGMINSDITSVKYSLKTDTPKLSPAGG
ncbi:MAG TPA: chitobiase/beta-hexosaminidase C-terminal domain-containing protein, partial [Spirochaetota bacterium]|nr:chitobiase/beta-hexosaminidase C-terminal domain-containing protein [Spirochaetota bacterium]